MVRTIIQARMNSTRLPNKSMKRNIQNKTLIERVYDNANVLSFDPIVAVPWQDRELIDYCLSKNWDVYWGSERDVLKRIIGAAEWANVDHIIRVCADSPFISQKLIIEVNESDIDYDYVGYEIGDMSTIQMGLGLYPECVSLEALKRLDKQLGDNHPSREHVTEGIYSNPKEYNVKWLSGKVSIDTEEEFNRFYYT